MLETPLSATTPPTAAPADDPPNSDGTAPAVPRTGHRILLSTTSSDSHTWNLVFLQLLLEECGHEVVNLGPCVPDALLVETARDRRPCAIVISTVNGHGRIDGARVARAVRRDPEIAQLPMVIGGKLGIEGTTSDDAVSGLLGAGFDAVFAADADPGELTATLGRMLPAHRMLPAWRPEPVEAGHVR
jgi:methylaspartate mutase sigma subunit